MPDLGNQEKQGSFPDTIHLVPRNGPSRFLESVSGGEVSVLERKWPNGKVIMGIGVPGRHPTQRTDPSVPHILERAGRFDRVTQGQKRVMVYEGGTLDIDTTRDPLDILEEHPNRDAAMMYVWAAQHGIEARSGELSDAERAQRLLAMGYTREEILLCSAMRELTAWAAQAPEKRMSFQDHMQRRVLDRYSHSYEWADFDFSMRTIEDAYLKIYQKVFNEHEAKFCHDEVISPMLVDIKPEDRSRMQQLSHDDNDNRDKYYGTLFKKLLNEDFNVLTVLGETHLHAISDFIGQKSTKLKKD